VDGGIAKDAEDGVPPPQVKARGDDESCCGRSGHRRDGRGTCRTVQNTRMVMMPTGMFSLMYGSRALWRIGVSRAKGAALNIQVTAEPPAKITIANTLSRTARPLSPRVAWRTGALSQQGE
jgi:hypothetical protein